MSGVSADELAVLQLLRVKGTEVRETVGSAATVAQLISAGLVEGRAAGGTEYLTLTPAGEAARAAFVDGLRGGGGGGARLGELDTAYERDFLPLNARFKELCAQWQQVDDRWPLLEQLLEIDEGIRAFLTLATEVSAHYSRYLDGLATALTAVEDGDVDALVAPVGPSYHNLWFELHEDLLVLLGRNRADEGET